jgi:hypothetical protein
MDALIKQIQSLEQDLNGSKLSLGTCGKAISRLEGELMQGE